MLPAPAVATHAYPPSVAPVLLLVLPALLLAVPLAGGRELAQ